MLVGHVAAALAAKRAAPAVPLAAAMFGSVFPDLLWSALLLAGVERIELQPGRGAAGYFGGWHIPFSHSLAMDAVWASLFALVCLLLRRGPRAAWTLSAAVLSHWVLDAISNRSMPLAPGVAHTVGLNVWSSVPATLLIEGGLLVAGILLWRPRTRRGTYIFWSGLLILMLPWYGNIAGPPPAGPVAAAIGCLVLFTLIVAWASVL
jgi:membrane-bound metal-dependent hydrolase YbcI (DUF457 family)